MKASEFKDWIKSIERMSRGQRDKLRERLKGRAGADTIIELIEQGQNDERTCPCCQGTKLYRWGKASELQRYRCRHCNRTFNALTGTALARLRHKDKWFDYEQAMVQGASVRKAAISCGIIRNTSFKWRHRFLQVPAIHQSNKMNGIVEADEMYFLESSKGQRYLPRAARKRGGKAAKRGTAKEQVPVLMVRDRHGETADRILHGTNAEQIESGLIPLLSKDVILCTDGMPAYRQITRHARIVHRPVNIAAGQRVINDVYHIQNVNAYGSRLGQNVTPTLCFLMSLGKTRQFQQLITT